MKRVLMIAYHFPPLAGSSGVQRTLRFVQHLPQHGWEPLVLTAHPVAYQRISADLLADVPARTVVQRAFALDTARHLAIKGRYPGGWARPDRWASWRFDAVRRGMAMIKALRPDAIWSTYPIPTAHRIAAELHRRSGLPWIADFRDPMVQDNYPPDPRTWQQFQTIEQEAAARARWCVFTTPGALRTYQARYPHSMDRMVLVENGYDEQSFAGKEAAARDKGPLTPGRLTLLHSGIVYPAERDPTQLFEALARVVRGPAPLPLQLRLRAPVHDALLRQLAERHGLQSFVEILPPVPYAEALEEMLRADGLLVLQAANCNDQVPAKLYEYLRAKRPILCLSDPEGDTRQSLGAAGVNAGARLDDAQDIERLLREFCRAAPTAFLPDDEAVRRASREQRTQRLVECLEAV